MAESYNARMRRLRERPETPAQRERRERRERRFPRPTMADVNDLFLTFCEDLVSDTKGMKLGDAMDVARLAIEMQKRIERIGD
jgi:hypothetical protein